MENERPTLYTGVTNNLVRRGWEHKNDIVDGFTRRYSLHKLVYFEVFDTIEQAIIREKQIKDMNRKEKIETIRKFNPEFRDLYEGLLH